MRKEMIIENNLGLGCMNYPIYFLDTGIISIKKTIDDLGFGSLKTIIITDTCVYETYQDLIKELVGGNLNQIITFPNGETNKNIATYTFLVSQMQKRGYGRDTLIIAFGGGVVGDMAGFVAGTYTRGVSLIQIPTTLLAQVDSSIGGKTGIDQDGVKNMVGVFKNPNIVIISQEFIKTLTEIDYLNGFAEIVKHAVIKDKVFFEYLLKNVVPIKNRNFELSEIGYKNCEIKGSVVKNDPEEKGERKILNYGHTIGHAIESLILKVDSEFRHGYAISIGMSVEGKMAHTLGFFSTENYNKQQLLLESLGLPTKIPNNLITKDIISLTSLDKKSVGGITEFALPRSLGLMHDFGGKYSTPVEYDIICRSIDACR